MKLGLLLDKGEINASDYGEAKIWFERACELGQVIGCHNLGVAFEYGKNGCQKNYDESRKYYFKAANAGYMHSQYNLGSLYSNNYFPDDLEGYKWMLIAKKTAEACSSEPICKWVIKDPPGHRAKLRNRLSPSQIESVRKAVSSWAPTKQ